MHSRKLHGESKIDLRSPKAQSVQARASLPILTFAALLTTFALLVVTRDDNASGQVQVDRANPELAAVGQTQNDADGSEQSGADQLVTNREDTEEIRRERERIRRETRERAMRKIEQYEFKRRALEQSQSDLNAHRELWEASEVNDYAYEFIVWCHFLNYCGRPIRVNVSNGVVQTMVYSESDIIVYARSESADYVHDDIMEWVDHDSELSVATVNGMFEMIQDAIFGRADGIWVRYDADLGHPMHFSIDYLSEAIDDEIEIEILRLSSAR